MIGLVGTGQWFLLKQLEENYKLLIVITIEYI